MPTIKTMIVDDEARIRKSIERLVQSCGTHFEIVAACADGKEALQYMHDTGGAVDIVISDVKMPEMDGMQFVREAKKHYTFSPLFISGYDDFEYLRDALREGAADYILKPIDREQLRARIAEISNSIMNQRRQLYRMTEMERKAQQLLHAKQTQALIEATSTSVDLARLGYWVDDFPKGVYLLMNISLDALPFKARAYTDQDWKAYSYALENIISEIVSNPTQGALSDSWLWRGDSGFWVLLYGTDAFDTEPFRTHAMALSEQICASISRHTPFTATITQADPVEDLYLLRNAKQTALSLVNYRFILGGNRIFRSDLLEREGKLDTGKMDAPFVQTVQRLKLNVQRSDLEGAMSEMRKCFEQLEKSDSPLHIGRLVQYLCIQIHSVWMESSEAGEAGNALEQALQTMKRAVNLHQMKSEMKQWIEGIAEAIRQEREQQSDKPVEQARTWIMEHLHEELTVKLVADHVHMNPTYFCKYFKTQTGETIFNFITRMRVEKAKTLLRDRGSKLQDISLQVGYQDTKYFSKLFKQLVGQTPSQYRDSIHDKA